MELYEVMFIIQFLAAIGIIMAHIFNAMHKGDKWDMKVTWLLAIGFFIAWLVALVTFMLDPEETLYLILFRLETGLFLLNIALLIIHLFYSMAKAVDGKGKAYNAQEMYLKNKL